MKRVAGFFRGESDVHLRRWRSADLMSGFSGSGDETQVLLLGVQKKNTAFLSKCKDPPIKVPLCSAVMESHRLNHPTQSNLNGGGRLDLLFVIGALIQRSSRVQRREHAAFLQQRATPNSCIIKQRRRAWFSPALLPLLTASVSL